MANFNGIMVKREKETIFIPLPREQWREIEGGCACEFCSENGASAPAYWDTIAVGAKPEKRNDSTWMVHYPQLQGILPKVVRG